jgi:predicted ATP-dependent endonuclease of OLD family
LNVIEKIEISFFRSFSQETSIFSCKDLNVFSGKNDSGKSNILKALNLYFTEEKVDFYNYLDFKNDFSKIREKVVTSEQVKEKKLFKIRILPFLTPHLLKSIFFHNASQEAK